MCITVFASFTLSLIDCRVWSQVIAFGGPIACFLHISDQKKNPAILNKVVFNHFDRDWQIECWNGCQMPRKTKTWRMHWRCTIWELRLNWNSTGNEHGCASATTHEENLKAQNLRQVQISRSPLPAQTEMKTTGSSTNWRRGSPMKEVFASCCYVSKNRAGRNFSFYSWRILIWSFSAQLGSCYCSSCGGRKYSGFDASVVYSRCCLSTRWGRKLDGGSLDTCENPSLCTSMCPAATSHLAESSNGRSSWKMPSFASNSSGSQLRQEHFRWGKYNHNVKRTETRLCLPPNRNGSQDPTHWKGFVEENGEEIGKDHLNVATTLANLR